MKKDRIISQMSPAEMGIGFIDGYHEIEMDTFDETAERIIQKKKVSAIEEIEVEMGTEYEVNPEPQS